MNGKSVDKVIGRSENGGRQRLLPVALATLLTALLFFTDNSPVFAASYVVDTTSDSVLTACTGAAGDCSLRGAISSAAANAGADTITFDVGVFPAASTTTITIGSGLPALSVTQNGGRRVAEPQPAATLAAATTYADPAEVNRRLRVSGTALPPLAAAGCQTSAQPARRSRPNRKDRTRGS